MEEFGLAVRGLATELYISLEEELLPHYVQIRFRAICIYYSNISVCFEFV